MWSAIALIAATLAAASIFLLASAWRLYRREKTQRGADLKVGQWLRERSIRDVLLRRGPARLTYRSNVKSSGNDD